MIDSEKTNTANIERLIIYTVVLLSILLLILQINFSILTVIPFTVLYFFIIMYTLILPLLKNKASIENLNRKLDLLINNPSKNMEKVKKIATKNYFFYDGMFYTINKITKKTIAIPFSDILEITKTKLVIHNVSLWKVVAIYNNKKVSYKFKHNYSLGNSNFPDFLKEVKRKNPKVNISKLNP